MVVSRLDPKYARDTPGAPKATVVAGLVKDTGMAFIEGPALNQMCTATISPQSISDMEQEMAALLR